VETQAALTDNKLLKFATYNPDTESIEYLPCTKFINQPASKDRAMVEFVVDQSNVSILVTDRHQMYVGTGDNKPMKMVEARDLLGDESSIQILAGVKNGLGDADAAAGNKTRESAFAELGIVTDAHRDAFLELYGYWLEKGSLEREGRGTVLVKLRHFSDEPYMRKLFQMLPLVESKDWWMSSDETSDDIVFVINPASWVAVFYAEYAFNSPDHLFSWALDGAHDTQLILRGLDRAHGNGQDSATDAPHTLYTQDIHFRDELIRACIHAGHTAHFEQIGGGWNITHSASTTITLNSKTDILRATTYDGPVWCVEVPPFNTIIVRRTIRDDNKTLIKASRSVVVGNCISRWLKTRSTCPLDDSEWDFARY
jgi:hypothetical protein